MEGRVRLNGKVVREMGLRANPEKDLLELDNKRLTIGEPRKMRYIALHKPVKVLCSMKDEKNDGRKLAVDFVPEDWREELYPVGRLDYWSEGLLFLTNDGDFALKVTHPRFQVSKVYRVLVDQDLPPESMRPLMKGVEVDGEVLKATQAEVVRRPNPRDRGGIPTSEIEITLTEGKNREIRRMCESLGWKVLRLKRIQIGKIPLGEIKPGRWRALTLSEIQSIIQSKSNIR